MSSKRNYYMISPRVIIKAIIIADWAMGGAGLLLPLSNVCVCVCESVCVCVCVGVCVCVCMCVCMCVCLCVCV